MHSKSNWDDLRFVLAVSRAGSVSAAARQLQVNHATVIRRVAQFEETSGIELFEKSLRGYRMAPGVHRVLVALENVQAAVEGVGRAVSGLAEPVGGTVRVTSTDTLCLHVLPEILSDMRHFAGALHIDLITLNAHLDLSRLDADLTVRPSPVLPDDLVGEQPAMLGMSCYRPVGLKKDVWLGMTNALRGAPAARWMDANVPVDQVVGSGDSFPVLAQMASRGMGMAFLPRIVGDADPKLERVDVGAPELNVPLWVASHKDMIEVPRIRATCTLLSEGLAKRAGYLLAETPPG